MIFSFNPEVFEVEDNKIQLDVTSILIQFLSKKFLWDSDNLFSIFFDDEKSIFDNSKTRKYVTDELAIEIGELANFYLDQSAYITDLHKFYLNSIVIGVRPGEVSPSIALKLLSEPALVLLENSTNDWNFIRGIIRNYCTHKRKKNIFEMIDEAVECYNLIPYQVGGGGEFVKVIGTHISGRYRDISLFKLIAIFDSDRGDKDSFNEKWYNLVRFLKGQEFDRQIHENWEPRSQDIILWHMLYKREIENYIPKDLLFECFPEFSIDDKEIIDVLTPDEYDFFNFDPYLEDHKNESSKIFLKEQIRTQIQQRCSHHLVSAEKHNKILEQIEEPEFILQKLAKLI